MFVSLDIVKQHLNIDSYYTDDDEYLRHLINVAETVVERHIDCDFKVLMDEVGQIPTPLLQAILLFIGNLYQSRESVAFASAVELPLSFRYLLDLYMDYSSNMCVKPYKLKMTDNVIKKEEIPPVKEEPEYAPLEPMRPPKKKRNGNKNTHNKYDDEGRTSN